MRGQSKPGEAVCQSGPPGVEAAGLFEVDLCWQVHGASRATWPVPTGGPLLHPQQGQERRLHLWEVQQRHPVTVWFPNRRAARTLPPGALTRTPNPDPEPAPGP